VRSYTVFTLTRAGVRDDLTKAFMRTDTRVFQKLLTNGDHIRAFVIDAHGTDGWSVREEHDREVVQQKRYRDWHRVERAMNLFAWKATQLSDSGWTES